MRKSIFLTTVNETRHRLDLKYYCHQAADGKVLCATGISVPEAGAKLILGSHHIDRILVIGSPSCAHADEVGKNISVSGSEGFAQDVRSMSEYGFFLSRIREFMDGTDPGYPGMADALSKEEEENITRRILSFYEKHADKTSTADRLFLETGMDPALTELFEQDVCVGLSPDGARWAKHCLYSRMDDSLKLSGLLENRNASVCFLPVETDGVLSVESMAGIIREILREENDEIELFADAQGMSVTDGSVLISTLLMLNRKTGFRCSLSGLIETEQRPEHFLGRVLDVKKSYNIAMLITGLEQFLDYGRDTQLKKYWETLEAEDPDADVLFAGMDLVDEGVSLCQIDLISAGITAIRDVIRGRQPSGARQSFYLGMILNAIRADYGKLLEGEELSLIELIKWSLYKGFYQQTLTIIESRIPADMICRGIYYYAKTKEDIGCLLAVFNEIYWTKETWKTRYVFSDPEHYFVRHYMKDRAGGGQTAEEAARAYAALRIAELHDTNGTYLPAYSVLGDDSLLEEILYGYYLICSLRNRVNHALTGKDGLKLTAGRTDSRNEIRRVLEVFIDQYSKACESVMKPQEILRISREDTAAYIKKHKISLENSSQETGLPA